MAFRALHAGGVAELLAAAVLCACASPSPNTGESSRGVKNEGAKVREAGAAKNDAGAPNWVASLPPVDVKCEDQDSTRLYHDRIEPLFADDRPSSCNECHLSGLDLQLFVRDTPCETMACMVSMGLIDQEDPDQSEVLSWIARASPESDLITQDIVEQEYQGFREWIYYSAKCNECDSASCALNPDGGAFCPGEAEPVQGYQPSDHDPGGCDDAALLEVFRNTVYASRGRCSPCHYTDHAFEDYLAPQWLDVAGDCESASRKTYWNVLDRGYVDVDDPASSLILLKPLSQDLGGVEHGGHDKFYSLTEDQGYLNFRYFVDRYVGCQQH
jgi:hypothetical protein